jgi:hypothetical protein
MQNFAVSGTSAPQASQTRAMRWLHFRQNFSRAGLSCRQRGQRVVGAWVMASGSRFLERA